MTEEIYNKLILYRNAIIFLVNQSLNRGEIKNQFESSLNKIISILGNIQSEENKNYFINIMKEIKSELRREIIKACQEKQALINQYGSQCYELFSAEDYNSIIMGDYLIELCESKIDEIANSEEYEQIDQSKKRIYIYSSRIPKRKDSYEAIKLIREDLSSIPRVYYKDILSMVEDMDAGTYIGKEHKSKILKDGKLDNTVEHRAFNGVRLYENTIKSNNNKTARRIKELESELGVEIHFVYKIEIKKCTQANGLDKEREDRYKNEHANFEEIIPTPKKSLKELEKERKELKKLDD